ncbi:MAG: hypothetical protein WDN08_18210 [Rhizomicrobium sp.]
MIAAAPFLGPMASDPSLRGIMQSLQTALLGVAHGQATLADIARPVTAFGDTLGKSRGRREGASVLALAGHRRAADAARDAALHRGCSRSSTSGAGTGGGRDRRDPRRGGGTAPDQGQRRHGAADRAGAAVGRGVRNAWPSGPG